MSKQTMADNDELLPASEHVTSPLRLNSDLVQKAKIVAMFNGKRGAEYWSPLLGPIIEREYEKVMARIRKS